MKNKCAHYQAMIEFLMMTVVCIVIVYALVYIMQYYTEYSWRILALVSLDYP